MKTFKIYFDESGNTGQDLLNESQRIFVISSVKFSIEESKILKSIFENEQELHFVKLKNSQKGRNQIVCFLNNNLINEENIMVSFADKYYITVTQIVDQLIEPVFFNEGKDLYKNGMNIVFSNLLYYSGKNSQNEKEFEKMLNLFIRMFRIKTTESINDFFSHVDNYSSTLRIQEKQYLFDPIMKSKAAIVETLNNINKFSLDSTLSNFIVILDYWHKKLNSKIKVVFDQSKQIEYYRKMIEDLSEMPIEKKNVGYGDARLVFPLQIESLELKDSNEELNLQFADIIASSITFALNNKNPKHEKFRKSILSSKLLKLGNCHSLWPEPNFTSKSLGRENDKGENILDFLTNEKMKNKN